MSHIEYYNNLFDNYVNPFLDKSGENIKQNMLLKIIHSKNVKKNCEDIAVSESQSDEKIFIAAICGLFHDIGRFKQYFIYQTFRDDNSVYHGQLGIEVLDETGMLKDLTADIREIVIQAVYNHGLFEIPDTTKNEALYFSMLTRDADKIDIYRIVSEYYNKTGPRNIALEYGLSDKPVISEDIMQSFRQNNLISKSQLKTLNDFKLMQLSWIFDLNFDYSKGIILKNKYLDSILLSIPDIPQKEEIINILEKHDYR